MRDKIEDIKWYIQDHVKEIGGITVIVFAVVVAGFMLFGGKSDKDSKTALAKENTRAEMKQLEERSNSLREVFSEIKTVNQGLTPDNLVFKTSLYLKQPFLGEDELQNYINDYIISLKQKHNVDGKYLTGLELDIYDRKILSDKELAPRAKVYYMLKDKEEKEKEEKDEKPKKDALGNEIKSGKIQVERQVDKLNSVWEETVAQKDEPDYKDYELIITGFEPLNRDASVKPLSDEEFAFYLKLNQYSAITGSLTGGAQLYLQWDLGQNVFKDGVGAILKEFKAFSERQTKLGGLADYYDSVDVLKKSLAIERPQFLLFAETKEVVDGKEEAQAKLIKFNPNLYTDAIKENINKVSEDMQDGKIESKDAPKDAKGKKTSGKQGTELEVNYDKKE